MEMRLYPEFFSRMKRKFNKEKKAYVNFKTHFGTIEKVKPN